MYVFIGYLFMHENHENHENQLQRCTLKMRQDDLRIIHNKQFARTTTQTFHDMQIG